MVDQVTYRTTDSLRWGAGQGSDLSASQIDVNFWVLLTALQAIQAQANESAGIDHFVISGNNLFVHLTNHFVLGPYTLPTAQWNFRAEWTQHTSYAAFDVVTNDHAVYLVLMNHTSRTTFSAGANDGAGHSYYGLLLSAAPKELPQEGELGQVLQWQTSPNDVHWVTPTRNIGFWLAVAPDPVEVIIEYQFTEDTTFPASLTGSQFSCRTRPTVNQEFELYQDGGPVGNIIIHPSGAPTITFNHPIDWSAGEVLSVIGPTIPDPHMTGIRFNFVGLLP